MCMIERAHNGGSTTLYALPYLPSNEEDDFSAKAFSLAVYQAPMPKKPQVRVFKNPNILIKNPNTILLA